MCMASRLDSFTIKDLGQPEKGRTMNILSAIVNFVKFSEEQADLIRSLQSQDIYALEEQDRLIEEINVIQKKVDEIKYVRDSSSRQ